ncbi:MAG: DUF4922 domain-containing protein [Paludibacteraceae bacterium]|nr:DUF4922 domain-containing protein [Paludibacteraceae bacterium]
MNLFKQISDMFSRELSAHGRAFVNYQALSGVEVKDMTIDGFPAKLFFNPARVRSVMADVSPEALQKRACFLCPDGVEENQLTHNWESPTGHTYYIRVNPFPIFSPHFTVSSSVHERQELLPHLESMLHLAKELPEMTIFYNGPMCGASAPDHMHFQAVPRHSLPIEDHFSTNYANAILVQETDLQSHLAAVKRVLAMGTIPEEASQTGSLTAGASHAEEYEPRWNIVSWYEPASSPTNSEASNSPLGRPIGETPSHSLNEASFNTIVFFRRESRPMCFFAPEEERILFSPATVEMAGIDIVANRESFDRLTPARLRDIIREVADNPCI